jgi:oxygen-independent coproporphyrinogen-3 oxidase
LAMTAYDKSKLDEFASDGLIEYDADHLSMTSEGSPFVRNVAATFDRLMINTTKQFSKPI